MFKRSPFTTLLLLGMLAGILLISGALQSAFDCLSGSGVKYVWTMRVDQCHMQLTPAELVAPCPNKACHQVQPQQRDLADPTLSSLRKLSASLASTPRLPLPQLRCGQPLELPPAAASQLLTAYTPPPTELFSQQRTLRTTVLLN